MGKKRARDRIVNPQPFLAEQPPMVSKKPKPPKRRSLHDNHHHEQPSSISNSMSDKILKEAYKQQKQIIEEQNQETVAFPVDLGDKERQEDEEEDLDDFAGFDDTQSQFDDYEDQINEADERLLESFLSKDAGPQRTLGDIIAARIKEQEATESSGRPMPKLDNKVIEHYKMMGKLLSTYTDGQLPKGLKPIPAYKCWQEILYLTEPEKWSPSALYQVTRIFASNMNKKKAERFYKLVLLPRFKEDIRKHKRLHTALFQSLKKALYKPSAFNKGILIPLFESGNCSLREAAIMGSVIQKMSIPLNHSSGLLLRLAEMDYCGTTSYIIKTFIDKKYALPYRVLDALVAHFMRFLEDPRAMPVIWHQTLLAFVQRYKHELRKEDKDNLNALMQKQSHYLVTPEISRELKDSRNRGEKEDDNMLMLFIEKLANLRDTLRLCIGWCSSPVSIINKTIQEDRFDIPEVPMEED